MNLLRFLIVWGRRLPASFSIPLACLLAIYLLLVTLVTEYLGSQSLNNAVWKLLTFLGFPQNAPRPLFILLFAEGILAGLLIFLGVILSYNLAALIHRSIRRRPHITVIPPADPAQPVVGNKNRLDQFKRIGIILAGGGAKGCYQAGAMRAIYEFLEENEALDKVKMIAGTSIGSWNAMFWLAGLVKAPGSGKRSMHEEWWRTVGLNRIVEFANYWPMKRNYFLLNTPWREAFESIFLEGRVKEQLSHLFSPAAGMHFYFTRANVARGHLEFSTNWEGIRTLTRQNFRNLNANERVPIVPSDRFEIIENSDDAIRRMEQAVFASMDLPPLFPYANIRTDMTEWFEDGGVVENIPVWFGTQIEKCDLLFVLPLNATFNEKVNFSSVVHRLTRVLSVRQGVLEKNAMKLAYLYNELAAAREQVGNLKIAGDALAQRALSRDHKPVSVFAICPDQPLAVGTGEFWKTGSMGEAFDLMYAETKYELNDRFEEATNPKWLRMAAVQAQGGRVYMDEF
jgi:predicted acylesterase/phospholipase RssA